MSRTFELVFRFTDDPEDPNVLLVSSDDDLEKIRENWEALANAARDLYIAMMEERAANEDGDDPRYCLHEDRINLLNRSCMMDRRKVVLCPESLLPRKGDPMH